MTRIHLHSWSPAIDDCIRSIDLDPANNMKAYYLLAQAQLALKHPNEALQSALTAYDECLKTSSSSTRNVCNLVLQAKKDKWEFRERERVRRRSALLRELEEGIWERWRREDEEVGSRYGKDTDSTEAQEEKADLESSTRRKVEELYSIFAIADPTNLTVRVTTPYPFLSFLFSRPKPC